MKQELLAPFSEPAKSQFFLPHTNGRIEFSASLLSGVSSGHSMYFRIKSQYSSVYATASPNLRLCGTVFDFSSSQILKESKIGFTFSFRNAGRSSLFFITLRPSCFALYISLIY